MSDNKANDELFLQLLMANQYRIFAYVLTLMHNRNDAEDVMQNTITLLWRKFEEFEPGSDFTAWGMSFAKLQVLKFFRDHQKTRIQFSDEIISRIEDKLAARMDVIDKRVYALKSCLQKLSGNEQKLLKLRYEENLTIKKVADVVGQSAYSMYRGFSRIHHSLMLCVRRTLAETEFES